MERNEEGQFETHVRITNQKDQMEMANSDPQKELRPMNLRSSLLAGSQLGPECKSHQTQLAANQRHLPWLSLIASESFLILTLY